MGSDNASRQLGDRDSLSRSAIGALDEQRVQLCGSAHDYLDCLCDVDAVAAYFSHLTEVIPYQSATIRRSGKPC